MSKYLELVGGSLTQEHLDKQKNQKPYVAYSIKDDNFIYSIAPEPIVYDPYVTFTAEEDGSSIGLNTLSTNQTLEYSTDTAAWNIFKTTTNLSLNNGDKVYIRGVLSADNRDSNYTQFKMSGKIAVSGNCNALWNYEDLEAPLKGYCGYRMFYGCTSLTSAPELPATMLVSNCYAYMFYGCTSLTSAPELPATELDYNCYAYMFYGCTSLTSAPELPATKLSIYCCQYMFYGCTSLTTAPELSATELSTGCYNNMFYGCTSLTSAPEVLPATELYYNCYAYMFAHCTSLTTTPELPATTLAQNCYGQMFYKCTSLATAPELPATTLAQSCYSQMFYKCTSLATAPELPATKLADYCYSEMFYGCTSLTTTPKLPATTLAASCYQSMFSGCTKLNKIICLATDISATNCTKGWVYGVASTGTFVKYPNRNPWSTGTSGIPWGWDVQDASYTPQECVKLEITADDVSGRKTNTTIYYTATTNGVDYRGNRVEGQIITGTAISNEFEQNKSYTDTVERTITFEFMGVTATTTITQGVWVDKSCEVVLNDQWRLSETQSNPDSTLYDGVYESFSNKGVDNSIATMYLDLVGYTEFDVYIRSYAESSYDYVTISEPNASTEKASTKGKQNSGQDINSYTKVYYDNLTGDDRITITYKKDGSQASGNDQGYVLIPKQ